MKVESIWSEIPILKLVVTGRHTERLPGAPAVLSRHRHSFHEVGIVLAGECDWLLGGRRRLRLRQGEAVLVPAERSHAEKINPGGKAELAWVGFDFPGTLPAWAERVVPLGTDFPEIAALFQVIYREHSPADERSRRRVQLALQSLLLLLSRQAERTRRAGSAARTASALNPRQIRALEAAAYYFRENLRAPLRIAQVAAYHSLCPAYFSTLFRKHYGLPPRTFVRRARVEQAAELLTRTDLSVKEIGARCGFIDASHFTKAFVGERGVTPGRFRA